MCKLCKVHLIIFVWAVYVSELEYEQKSRAEIDFP